MSTVGTMALIALLLEAAMLVKEILNIQGLSNRHDSDFDSYDSAHREFSIALSLIHPSTKIALVWVAAIVVTAIVGLTFG